ncbi:MAG: glycosyltransferase [Proteobacteria bacterium]|nr:glycosyltransferase [Pseudomonadota bacterium]
MANLQAIDQVNPQMAERLRWPVNSSHVRFVNSARDMPVAEVNYRDTWHTLNTLENPQQEASDTAAPFCRNNGNCDALIFGVGLGYYVEALLAQYPPGRTLHLYDRDPWLIRLMLTRIDLISYISSGRIRLYMGSDLTRLRSLRENMGAFFHPVLSLIYNKERQFYEEKDIQQKKLRVLLGEGGLFVDDVAETLRSMGHDVLPWLPRHVSAEELTFQLKDFCPDAVFHINYLHGLATFLENHRTKFICWEIDPVVDRIPDAEQQNARGFIFTYNPQYIEHYQEAGFRQVEYLPLAANTAKRRPLDISPEQKQRYGAKVSFVGASMMEQAEDLKSIFLKIPPNFFGKEAGGKNADSIFHEILTEQSLDEDTYRIPKILARYMEPGKRPFFNHDGTIYNVEMLIGETAAMERRMKIVSGLAPHGIHVWGDAGWETIAGDGVYYKGHAGHHKELNYIYNAATVNLDINRFFQKHIVTMRVFDVLSCGGFLLTEHSSALKDLFDVGREIIACNTIEELHQCVDYYLKHPEKRKEITLAGREAVLKRHDMKHRIAHMLKTAGFTT